jgi:hypothetical protein
MEASFAPDVVGSCHPVFWMLEEGCCSTAATTSGATPAAATASTRADCLIDREYDDDYVWTVRDVELHRGECHIRDDRSWCRRSDAPVERHAAGESNGEYHVQGSSDWTRRQGRVRRSGYHGQSTAATTTAAGAAATAAATAGPNIGPAFHADDGSGII